MKVSNEDVKKKVLIAGIIASEKLLEERLKNLIKEYSKELHDSGMSTSTISDLRSDLRGLEEDFEDLMILKEEIA